MLEENLLAGSGVRRATIMLSSWQDLAWMAQKDDRVPFVSARVVGFLKKERALHARNF